MMNQLNDQFAANNLRFGGTDMTQGELRLHLDEVNLEQRAARAALKDAERAAKWNENW